MNRGMWRPISLIGAVGAFLSGGYALFQEYQSSKMISSAIERLPETERLFESHVRFELPQEEREQIENCWERATYGVGGMIFGGVLFGLGMLKYTKIREIECKNETRN